MQDQRYELQPGDSLLFAAHLRHRWRNPGKTVTNALDRDFGLCRGPHTALLGHADEAVVAKQKSASRIATGA